jgi:hydroxypyruvate reductase
VFQAAVAAVDGRRCVRERLQAERSTAQPSGEWHLIGVGKAAGAMALGALDVFGQRIVSGLVIVPPGHVPADLAASRAPLEIVFGSHPVPDAASVHAGEQLAAFVAGLPRDARVLCLVSGGASSLVELPVPGVGLDELQRVGTWALTAGEPIDVVNAVRRSLSQLKNGGLARMLDRRETRALLISDVPGDDPRVIGSGLLHPSTAGESAHRPVPFRIVASQRSAAAAAAQAATARELHVTVTRQRLAGDAAGLGEKLARATAKLPDRALRIWTGESTVALPLAPGRGGRNQHLALSAACTFAALRREGVFLLAAGTDGVDGVTDDAGALVDAHTCLRGSDAGRDCRVSLARADSGTFLEAAGDLLHTGPTYTNVGDMVLGLCWNRGE